MQSFTVCVMIGVSTDIFLFFLYLFLSVYFFYFFYSFRFYLCTIFIIIIIIIIFLSKFLLHFNPEVWRHTGHASQTLVVLHLRAQGLGKGDEHLPMLS